MSQVITFGNPAASAICAPAMTPAAGPDSAVRTGSVRAVSADMTPPLDCTMSRSPRQTGLREPALQPPDIRPDHRLQADIECRRRGPFELADLRQNERGRVDMVVRPDAADRFEGGDLIVVIGIGVDEHDTDRLAPQLQQVGCGTAHLVGVHRLEDRAIGECPFVDLDRHVAGHDVLEAAPQPPGVGTVAPTHLQDVTKSLGRDQSCLSTLALQERVGPDGRAVDHRRDPGRAGNCRIDPVDESLGDVAAHRWHLCRTAPARRLVDKEDVGEGFRRRRHRRPGPPCRSRAVFGPTCRPWSR